MPDNLRPTIDTDRGFSPSEMVRIHEANCQIDFATAQEQNFRVAWMCLIARKAGLPELRGATITGSGTGVPRPSKEASRA